MPSLNLAAHQKTGKPGKVGSSEVKMRKGGYRLLEYISSAAPDKANTDMKKLDILDENVRVGTADDNRVPSWCGILALWVQRTAGNGGGNWPGPWSGPSYGDSKHKFYKNPKSEPPRPGDIAYRVDKSHHGTVVRVDGDTVVTVDGNIGGKSVVAMRVKPMSYWAGFVRAVDKGKG